MRANSRKLSVFFRGQKAKERIFACVIKSSGFRRIILYIFFLLLVAGNGIHTQEKKLGHIDFTYRD